MAQPIRLVRPGDLITAEFMNSIVAEIQVLQAKVKKLEDDSAEDKSVAIDGLSPSGSLHIGDELEVRGRNFPVPVGRDNVHIDTTEVERFRIAAIDRLVFNIPSVGRVPGEVILTIRNPAINDEDSIKFLLLPRAQEPPGGEMVIRDRTASLGKIEIGKTYTLRFELESQTTIAETYQIEAVYSDLEGDATLEQWKAHTTLVSSDHGLITQPIKLERFTPIMVTMNVTVPAKAKEAKLALRAKSLNNDAKLTRTSNLFDFTVGSEQQVSHPNTSFILQEFGGASLGRFIQDEDGFTTIEIPYRAQASGEAVVTIRTKMTKGGRFKYEAAVVDAGTLWKVENLDPPNSVEPDNGGQELTFTLKLESTRPASPEDHPEKRTLIVKALRTDNDVDIKFTSFVRYFVRGYVLGQ